MIEKPVKNGLFSDDEVQILTEGATGMAQSAPEAGSQGTITRSKPIRRRRSPTRRIFLTPSQQAAASLLVKHFIAHTGQNHVSGFRVRPPLLIGPSGAGKTTTIRALAAYLKLPYKIFTHSDWIVQGATKTPNTVDVILDFVRSNPSGILAIDELDKAGNNFERDNGWHRGVRCEMMNLLTGEVSSFREWLQADVQKYQTHFWAVGLGTWQHLYRSTKRVPTFAGSDQQTVFEHVDFQKLMEDGSISEELLARFNEPVVLRCNHEDFVVQLERIQREIKAPLPEERKRSLIQAALASGKGMRAIEDYVSEILLSSIPDVQVPASVAIQAASSPIRSLTPNEETA